MAGRPSKAFSSAYSEEWFNQTRVVVPYIGLNNSDSHHLSVIFAFDKNENSGSNEGWLSSIGANYVPEGASMGKGHTTPILTKLSTVFVSSGRTDIGYRLLSGRTGVRIPPWTSVHVAQLVERQKNADANIYLANGLFSDGSADVDYR